MKAKRKVKNDELEFYEFIEDEDTAFNPALDDYDLPVMLEDISISNDDRLWAALCYLQVLGFWPFGSILLLVVSATRERPYVRYHAILSLVMGAVWIVLTIMTMGIAACIGPFVAFYWAYKAYQGHWINIPIFSRWIASI